MSIFTENGRFFVGCNYWASHAGTRTWKDWDAAVVEEDFRRIASMGLSVLRVFPLWPDFQPLTLLRQGGGAPREYRFGEEPLPNTDAGRAGMSEVMLGRFGEMCALAEKYNLKLLVGLITGWMSGRFFAPEPLEHLNVLTDPEALMWEARFVHCFVRRFKNSPAIAGWDLGNECNCMGPLNDPAQAYVWATLITDAIRAEDTTRPVVSGMHSLQSDGIWRPREQGEILDVLTTHPYVLFTPHCDIDPIDTLRPGTHAVSETRMYEDLGHKPCFVEECGTLGPMFASEEIAAKFVRNNLFTLWAHNCRGFLWWCAADQKHLVPAPYDWNSVERELGLFRQNGEAKPVTHALGNFAKFQTEFPYLPLPSRITDGVCVLTRGQDNWGMGYIAFTLARQAGLDLVFAHADDQIPEAPLYLLPGLCGDSSLSRRALADLLGRVERGAALYLSVDSGLLCPFEEFTGLEAQTRCRASGTEAVEFGGERFMLQREFRLHTKAAGATVLAADAHGDPAFTVYSYGKGKVYFLAFPLEKQLMNEPGAFAAPSPRYSKFYEALGRSPEKIARAVGRSAAVTEHILDEHRRILVAVDYDSDRPELTLADGWQITQVWENRVFLAERA